MYRDIPSQPEREAVTNQPQDNLDLGSLDFKRQIPHHEKSRDALLDYDHEQNHPYQYGGHHTGCIVFLPLLLAPLDLCLLALIYVNGPDFINWGFNSLVGRDDTSTTAFPKALFIGLVILLLLPVAALVSIWVLWHARREQATRLTFSEDDVSYSRIETT